MVTTLPEIRARAVAAGPPAGRLDRMYIGERDGGRGVVLTVEGDGSEHRLGPLRGPYDWGWPSAASTARLARALLHDATGREAPDGVVDALATEELAHFPWSTFTITALDVIAWLEQRAAPAESWPVALRGRVRRGRSGAARAGGGRSDAGGGCGACVPAA